MNYKVTALKDVMLLANVRALKPQRFGNEIHRVPKEERQWITLQVGDVREGLGMVHGIHPRCLPDEEADHREGVVPVIFSNDQLPREFFALIRIEGE